MGDEVFSTCASNIAPILNGKIAYFSLIILVILVLFCLFLCRWQCFYHLHHGLASVGHGASPATLLQPYGILG